MKTVSKAAPPAPGVIFSTLGAIMILFVRYKLNIHFPRPNLAFQ
jgi:hypothetical protein